MQHSCALQALAQLQQELAQLHRAHQMCTKVQGQTNEGMTDATTPSVMQLEPIPNILQASTVPRCCSCGAHVPRAVFCIALFFIAL